MSEPVAAGLPGRRRRERGHAGRPLRRLGSFVLSRPEVSYHASCLPVDSGTATPLAIPDEPVPPLPSTFPRGPPGASALGHAAGSPWVAVLDWPTDHGWSVAATIREASDARLGVEFYDLTAAGMLSSWAPVSDLAVLASLCAVAGAAAAHPEDRPSPST